MRDSGQYDLLIWNVLVANTGDPENYLRENWYSTSANNTSGYANSEVDRLLDQLASEFDSNARRDLVMQIQQEIKYKTNLNKDTFKIKMFFCVCITLNVIQTSYMILTNNFFGCNVLKNG